MNTIHGGDIIATSKKLGCAIADLIDMSSNLSPLGPPTELLRELADRLTEISFLPEADSLTLRRKMAVKHNLEPDQIIAGSGTTEFIFAIPTALPIDNALIVNPTYGDYHMACNLADVSTHSFNLEAANNFELDINALAEALEDVNLVFICNPNNPTGSLIETKVLYDFVQKHRNTCFVVDESYLPFTGEASLLEYAPLDNLLILTSFSKIYCIPGLRLGFCTGSRDVIKLLLQCHRPWGVNRLAQIAGEWCIDAKTDYAATVRDHINGLMPAFIEQLDMFHPFKTFPTATNFVLCHLHNRSIPAANLCHALLKRNIMVRDCSNFHGLDPSYFRVSLRRETENNIFMTRLAEIMKTFG